MKEELDKAVDYALRALSRRDHSVAELERKLCNRDVPEEVRAAVVARLTKAGYLDDRRFAEQWAESAVRNGRGYGRRLSLELARRGIAREIVDDVVASVSASYDEAQTLEALVARKFSSLDLQHASDRDTRRVVAYLQRRGFSLALIFRYFRARNAGDGAAE